MPSWGSFLIQTLVMVAVVLVLYNVLKVYVFSKFKVNKWIVLVLSFVVFLVPLFFPKTFQGTIWTFVQSGIFIVLFMWFLDLSGIGFKAAQRVTNKRKDKKDDIVIRPKAKPNRVKNKKQE